MPKYKDRSCVVCESVYTPTSPRQKTCVNKECRRVIKRESDRINSRARRRVFESICLICSIEFKTTDSKRKYCGMPSCEEARVKRNVRNADERRRGKRSEYKKEFYQDNREDILDYKKKHYREVLHPDRDVKEGWSTCKHSLEFASEAFKSEGYVLLSDQEYVNSYSKLKVVCPNGHFWETSLHSFKDSNANRCMRCYLERPGSIPEEEIREFVKSVVHGNTQVVGNTRQVIPPYELDIYIPAKNLAIEYCGLRWHGEVFGGKARDYHRVKMDRCNEEGVRLITILEDEYLTRKDVVFSRIKNALGCSGNRIYARKTEFKEIENSLSGPFLDSYHLQGNSPSKFKYGLFWKGELVQVMTFGSLSRTHAGSKSVVELKRLASRPDVKVVGGASKLFSRAIKIMKELGYTAVKSYCDMRWANQLTPVYEVLGFELQRQTRYTPHYVMGQRRYRNQSLRKTPQERLTGKTEWELRREQGYDRIWDCGHRTYVYVL